MQLQYNPRNISGFGLSDGEVVERLWSYLRRFAAMTKEMHPSHRVDVLSDALMYYHMKSSSSLSEFSSYSHKIVSYGNSYCFC